jgi:predicted PurR-regulated permease PerM
VFPLYLTVLLHFLVFTAHLKLHPLLVLAVLVFAEHALGVWGLLIAVPLAVFFIEYVINRTPMEIEEGERLREAEEVAKASVVNRPWQAV